MFYVINSTGDLLKLRNGSLSQTFKKSVVRKHDFSSFSRQRLLSLNDAVLPGVNLLNALVAVFTHFRTSTFACVADISKCFFQVSIAYHESNKIGFVYNDINFDETQVFRFTRHVWGINSSPYIALFAIERLIDENPANASQLTLNAVESKRYRYDLLLSFDSLDELELVA